MSSKGSFYKKEKTDKVWWYDRFDSTGEMLFSFDRKKLYNLFRDYPQKLSVSEWLTFNKENGYWEEFFGDRNLKYREEHAEDIDKHLQAVEAYRIRRDGRVRARMDDGNTRLPFGLCEREGIEVGKDWTPEDAWRALEGKGYKASETYDKLESEGKVGDKPKKSRTTINETHFPPAMTDRAYRKNTTEFARCVNEYCDDDDTVEFLSCSMGKGGKMPSDIKCVRIKGADAGVTTYLDRDTRVPKKIEVAIPSFSSIKNKAIKAQKIREFAHEWTHFIDECARDEDKFGHFSDTCKEVQDAISEDDGSIGEDVTKLFEEYNKQFDYTAEKQRKEKTQALLDMAAREYGNGEVPEWVRKDDGGINYITAWRLYVPKKTMKEYEKKGRKIERDFHNKGIGERWSLMDGVSSLQGMYDSLNGGELRESGKTRLGHSREYFARYPQNRAIEILADYVALKVTSPKLAEMFKKDKPRIAKALDDEIIEITKRMKNGRD